MRIAIIGAGITGLSAAWTLLQRARQAGRPCAITMFERDGRVGGKVQTYHEQGMVMEAGPDSFVRRKPAVLELSRELGLADALIDAPPQASRMYVQHRDALYELPTAAWLGGRAASLADSPVLSRRAALRVALESRLPAAENEHGDESIAAFFRRRFGGQASRRLIEPLLKAPYAGDPERLSLDATYPNFRRLERTYGSVTAGLRRLRTEAMAGRTSPNAEPGTAVNGGSPFLTLRGGLVRLPQALHTAIRDHVDVFTNTTVTRLEPLARGHWRVTADGRSQTFDAVILTTPAFVNAELSAPFAADAAALLASIPYVSVAAVHAAFERTQVGRPMDGSGYVIPQRNVRFISGCTWISSKWPHTTPDGIALLRCFVGGAGGEDRFALPDRDVIAETLSELRERMQIRGEPKFLRITRWPRSLPQYNLGHLQRTAALDRQWEAWPSLAVAGAAYRGIGLPDCIEQGRQAAERIWKNLTRIDNV